MKGIMKVIKVLFALELDDNMRLNIVNFIAFLVVLKKDKTGHNGNLCLVIWLHIQLMYFLI